MTATIRGVPTIFGVRRTVETQDVDNFVETVENLGMDSAGRGSWTQSVSLGMSAGCQAQTAPLEFAGNHKKQHKKYCKKLKE